MVVFFPPMTVVFPPKEQEVHLLEAGVGTRLGTGCLSPLVSLLLTSEARGVVSGTKGAQPLRLKTLCSECAQECYR